MTIIRLVKKAQKGDDKAFLKLFQQYEADIYRMAFVYVKNETDALDVVQETAYRSFKNIDSLKSPEYFKTWLIKIAINCSLDVVRKKEQGHTAKKECEEMMGAEEEDIPLTLSLQDLIEDLNEEEKTIVLLRFYQNHTFQEIAGVLEIPLGTAKTVLYRALKKLKRELLKGEM